MPNKPHHGEGEYGKPRRGLMAMHAGAHMPLRHPSGGDRKPKITPTVRNGAHKGAIPKLDTRRRSGPEGNGKGDMAKGAKGAGLASHKGTAGRGGEGATNQTHSNRMSESPSHDWFEKLGC